MADHFDSASKPDAVRRRRLRALDRLEELAARIARDYPPPDGMPDAEAAVRRDRDRDEPPSR